MEKEFIEKCKKIENLYEEIMKNRENITDTINIGIALGVTPVGKEHKSRQVIEKDLQEMFNKLRENKISARRLPNINSYSLILDSRTGIIIHDGVDNENRITNIAIDRKIENKEENIR